MFLLDDLLFSPISGFKFILRTLNRIAEEQYTDDAPLKEQLLELQVRLDSGEITEDDYIGYLAQTDLANAVPVGLAARLRRSHFLFLGYAMADWNLRVILQRLWGEDPPAYRSWAVQAQPKPLDREFWRRRDVDIIDVDLEKYVSALGHFAGIRLAETTA